MNGYILVKTVDVDGKGMPTQPGGINGGIMKRPDPDAPPVLHYVAVDSIERTVERALALGAKLMKEKQPVPSMGWFAILIDSQGNPFAIWQTDAGAK